jgi:hypothetical protein
MDESLKIKIAENNSNASEFSEKLDLLRRSL